MATGFVLCILLHHHHHLAKVLLVAENLSHSDLNVSPQPPPCPLARPATTNASPRPERRLDNIVGQTQDTRKGPNGRKLDAPGRTDRQTDTTNDICCCWLLTGTPPIRCLANTGSVNQPYDASRIGTRPTPSEPPTASIVPVRGTSCSYTLLPRLYSRRDTG